VESRWGAANGTTGATERNWLPLAVALVLVAAVVVTSLVMSGRRPAEGVRAVTTGADPYAAQLPLTELVMSESGNLAGGKVTYVDGHIANRGSQTVRGVTVQVVFRNYAHEVAQNQTVPLTLIRMRQPYIDTESVSADPLKPGTEREFRLIFDGVTPDWAGEMPEIRIVHVN
jgi:hypothetical protein